MSGGVDSAVAAALAVEAGHDVTGVHLALSSAPAALRTGSRGCCSREDARDAARAADVLGIPFYVWDLAERFREDVVEVRLHHLFAVRARIDVAAAHAPASSNAVSASAPLRIRLPRWSLDITVPTGMSRIWAASA